MFGFKRFRASLIASIALAYLLVACGESSTTTAPTSTVTLVAPTSTTSTAAIPSTVPLTTAPSATVTPPVTTPVLTTPAINPTRPATTANPTTLALDANGLPALNNAAKVEVDQVFLDNFVANFTRSAGVGNAAKGWSYNFYTSEADPSRLLEDNVAILKSAGWQVYVSSITLFDGSGLTLAVYNKDEQNLVVGAQPMLKDLSGTAPFKGKPTFVFTIQGKGVLTALLSGGGSPRPTAKP